LRSRASKRCSSARSPAATARRADSAVSSASRNLSLLRWTSRLIAGVELDHVVTLLQLTTTVLDQR
jgi:hypothetical protein